MFIKIQSVCKNFGAGEAEVRALDRISFGIEQGESVAIHGSSGSGKSTLLNIIAGLLHPTAGSVTVDGIDLYEDIGNDGLARFRCEYIGFVFQAFNLIPFLNAYENTVLPLAHLDIKRKQKRMMAEEALRKVGLSDRMKHLPNELSGGQQQRVAIARALVNEPFIIIADEPTGNLDKDTRDEVMDLFSQLNAEGHTIISVTHDSATLAYAGRKIEIADGRLLEELPA
jgi:putative ABC transport system ATP-binding protein